MRKIKYIIVSAIAFSSLNISLNAQEIYSVEQCRDLGIKNNNKTKNANLSKEAVQQTKKEAFTNYFPNVSATGMGFSSNKGLLELEMAPGATMSLLENGVAGGVTATQIGRAHV